MAQTAAQVSYRQEYIAAFEEGQTWLRAATTTEAVIKGNQATFLVAGSGGATAVTRGVNGLIPARFDNLVQTPVTLVEYHDLPRSTRFNIFQNQGNTRRIMQETSVKVMNRKIDADIISAFDTASTNLGAATTASLSLVLKAKVTLGEAEVATQEEENMYGVVTPAFMGYLMQIPEFASADYVDMQPLAGKHMRLRRWCGINWIEHPNLTGVGTASEKCYILHKDSVGCAFDTSEGLKTAIGYDEEQDYYWARASSFIGAAVLQQSGIVQVLHDASAI